MSVAIRGEKMKYYTKDWYWSVSQEGLAVGFQPVPDQDEYTDEDIDRIHRAIVQQTYVDELTDLGEADINEIEKLFQKSVMCRREAYQNAEGTPWENVDFRLVEMGILPKKVYDYALSLDEKAGNQKKEDQERFEAILSKESIPESIDDFIHTYIQAYRFQQVDNGYLMAVRPMNRASVQTFLFENATVIENELYAKPGSIFFLQYGEAYDCGNLYEIHLLFLPFTLIDDEDEADLQYLTLRCTNLLESDCKETVVQDHYSEDKKYYYGVSMSNGYYVPWFKELKRIDENHTVYSGREIFRYFEQFAYSSADEAERALLSKLDVIMNERDKAYL